MSAPTLPRDERRPDRRARELAEQAAEYRWDYDAFKGIAAADGVPRDDKPDLAWLVKVADALGEILVNAAAVNRNIKQIDNRATSRDELLDLIKAAGSGGIKAALEHLEHFVEGEELEHVPVDAISDYEALFQTLPLPPVARVYRQDAAFARMRVAGPNPMMIHRVTALPGNFPVTEAHFTRAMESYEARGVTTGRDSLAAALGEGRAFLVDYAALDGLPGGSFPRPPKHFYAPLGLFVSTAAGRQLLPVAIQVGQRPGPDTPVLTPADGDAWLIAKTQLTVADGNVHQAVVHLAHTHLVCGPFRVAAKRNLAPDHPVARLLDPHGEGTLNINDAANTTLMKPKGGVEAVMAGSIETSRQIAVDAVKSWRFRDTMLLPALEARGLTDREALPDFPYRDDAELLHGALRTWVEACVRTWYVRDADVVEDVELQGFWRELGAQDGGRIGGLGQLKSVDYLVDALTHIIFTGSVQHAAVNFPQRDLMSYLPNFPLVGYTPPVAAGAGFPDYLKTLPWLDLAQYQSGLGHLLGSVHHTRLGHYSVLPIFGHFAGDRRLEQPLDDFKRNLDQIEATIHARNRSREPYEYLLPSKVPQSINI